MWQRMIFLLFPLFSFFSTDEHLIEWSAARKLTWDDFKGAPNPESNNAALTNSSIHVEFGYNEKGLIYSIKCSFNKSLSWGRIKNAYILNHEQGHFDIAEIHARLLNKALKAYTFNNKTVGEDVNRIYNDVIEEHVSFQKQYDLQTNHSLDSAAQRVWDNKIAAELRANEAYAKYN